MLEEMAKCTFRPLTGKMKGLPGKEMKGNLLMLKNLRLELELAMGWLYVG